jgi:AraC family transcriptional regulator of adaptative response/methylated-DNA-[protein]-cysteine methyltransferase
MIRAAFLPELSGWMYLPGSGPDTSCSFTGPRQILVTDIQQRTVQSGEWRRLNISLKHTFAGWFQRAALNCVLLLVRPESKKKSVSFIFDKHPLDLMSEMKPVAQTTLSGQPSAVLDAPRTGGFSESHRDRGLVFGNARTKIYSYPSCTSVKPSAGRIVLFRSDVEAEAAGFRLCRHCGHSGPERQVERAKLIESVCNYIRSHYTQKITLKSLGYTFSMSPFSLQKLFKKMVGVSPRRYLEELRIANLKARLSRGDSVESAVFGVGYSSMTWLYGNSRLKLGMTPSSYKDGGKGVEIDYAIKSTEIGHIMVAATANGICSISAADSEADLINALRKEFPHAILRASDRVEPYIKGVEDCLLGSEVPFPLDISGTDFEKSVWSALTEIPYGATATYSEIAGRIGKPRAVRAVANACAKNHLPLIIPCHRVIRKGGDLGGYGLGLDRKRKLLEMEKLNASSGISMRPQVRSGTADEKGETG